MSRHTATATTTSGAVAPPGDERLLVQLPFSHDCLKVRLALTDEGLDHRLEDIRATDRCGVVEASGQAAFFRRPASPFSQARRLG